MAEFTRTKPRVNYRLLHDSCSLDFSLEPAKKRKKRCSGTDVYLVERVIGQRKTKQGIEYLVKWLHWPMWNCSWEPEDNLNENATRSYYEPTIAADRLGRAAVTFLEAVLGILKCKFHRVLFTATVEIEHDIIRFVFRNKGRMTPDGKFMLYEKEDFDRFKLPQYWHYYLDELGQGVKVKFPIKMKTRLGFIQKRFIVNNGAVEKGPMIPKEKVIINLNRIACDKDLL